MVAVGVVEVVVVVVGPGSSSAGADHYDRRVGRHGRLDHDAGRLGRGAACVRGRQRDLVGPGLGVRVRRRLRGARRAVPEVAPPGGDLGIAVEMSSKATARPDGSWVASKSSWAGWGPAAGGGGGGVEAVAHGTAGVAGPRADELPVRGVRVQRHLEQAAAVAVVAAGADDRLERSVGIGEPLLGARRVGARVVMHVTGEDEVQPPRRRSPATCPLPWPRWPAG